MISKHTFVETYFFAAVEGGGASVKEGRVAATEGSGALVRECLFAAAKGGGAMP